MKLLKDFEILLDRCKDMEECDILSVIPLRLIMSFDRIKNNGLASFMQSIQLVIFVNILFRTDQPVPDRFSPAVATPLCKGSLAIFPAMSWHRGGRLTRSFQ